METLRGCSGATALAVFMSAFEGAVKWDSISPESSKGNSTNFTNKTSHPHSDAYQSWLTVSV